MIVQHKITAFIATAALAIHASPSAATLRSPSSLSPGDYCDTECQSSNCMKMRKTNISLDTDQMNYLPDCSDIDTTDMYGEACWLNKEKGNYMVCDYDNESACNFFAATGGLSDYADGYKYTNWLASINYRVIRAKVKMSESSYYNCSTTTTFEYGCAANYYASSGSGASIKCSACPQSGRSPIGTTSINDCYLPKGTRFSDSTGSGEYTDDCPY